MHVVVLSTSVPDSSHGGGAITLLSLIKSLHDRGYVVTFVLVQELPTDPCSFDEPAHHPFASLGIKILPFHVNHVNHSSPHYILSSLFRPLLCVATRRDRQRLNSLLEAFHPDYILSYHWESLRYALLSHRYPVVGLVGDPLHLPFLARKEFLSTLLSEPSSSFKSLIFSCIQSVSTKITILLCLRSMRLMLKGCTFSGAFAAHHAVELSSISQTTCTYLRTPIPDQSTIKTSYSLRTPSRLTLLHIGHLKGAATAAGLLLLFNHVLPLLEQHIGRDSYELRLVGGFLEALPASLKEYIASNPSITYLGHQADPSDEFLRSDALIVPTPIPLGIRVRILTAFSYGLPVIAHHSNASGIPELNHDYNCLLSGTPAGLVDNCLALYQSESKRASLGNASRLTFKTCFSFAAAGSSIIDAIDESLLRRSA